MILLDNDSDVYTIAVVAKKKETRKHMIWRPTGEDNKLMADLKSKLGVSESDILRLGLRSLADRELATLHRAG